MLNVYKRFWHVHWAEQWQYRASLLMYLSYWLVSPITYLAVWTTIANAQGSVNGLTAADFAAYYLTLLPIDLLTSSMTVYYISFKVQDGSMSNDLLRPVHPVLTGALVNNIAFKALQMMAFVPIWILLVVLFRPALTYTWQSLLLAVPVVVLSFLIRFLLESTITLISFWTTRMWSIYQFDTAISMMLNGAFVPLALMPGWVQIIAQILPYQLGLSFPVLLILNQMPTETIVRNLGLQLFWVGILYALFTFVWRRALKRYSAVGA